MSKRLRAPYFGAVATTLCVSTITWAAEPPGDTAVSTGGVSSLSAIVVEGQSAPAERPAGTTVTTRAQLDERAVGGWEDFSSRGDPAVNFSRQNNSVNIRGVDADRVVTVVDGIQVPWLSDGARGVKGGLRTVDFDTLSSIDVVRGAGAVQSGALTGALSLQTLSPEDLLEPGQPFGALVRSGYDSADDSWKAQAALAGRVGAGTRWLLQAGLRKGHELDNMGSVGGLGETRDKPDPMRYTQDDFLLKVQHEWRDAHRLTLTGESFHRWSNTDALSSQGAGEDYQPGEGHADEDLNRQRIVLGYAYRALAERQALDAGEFKLYWQRMRLEQGASGIRNDDARARIIPGDPFKYGYPSGAYGRSNAIEQSAVGAVTRWSGHVAGALAQHWAVGGDLAASRVRQDAAGHDNCPVVPPGLPATFGPRTCDFLHTNQADMPRVKGLVWSLWAQDEISWADGRYALTPALRFDSYRWSPQSDGSYTQNPNYGNGRQDANSGSRVSPSLLASYKAHDQLSFYAKYGYGFKAPSATQLYLNFGGPGTYLRKGNPDLKPEISHGWELGVDAGDRDLGGRLAYFDNRYRDFIDDSIPVAPGSTQWQPEWATQYPYGVTSSENRAHVRIYGIELSGHWSMTPNWYTRGALVWSHGRDQDTGQYLNTVAPLKASVALGYRTAQWGVEGLLSAAAARKHVAYPEATPDAPYADFKAPGYGVLDMTGWWKPAAVRGLRVQAGVYNLFDRKYWNALDVPTQGTAQLPRPVDYYTQPGRSVRVSLTYQY
ncbi:TonB-dependent hemoglobin/transferrin/lactoferrin family receptor [Castellaniella hirudinis]|uniref:TonB-dependent hemoglobin/transferrin/lactoferrin family receptor n=1 Tax=Castellaniella hirudinis TaxID=1144617 RepID=UPI0039C32C73